MSEPSSLTPLISTRPLSRFSTNPSVLWRTGALFVAAGILTSAFGSHALQSTAFLTGSHYAIFNGLGLCIISLHPRFGTHRFAGPAIAVGGFIFSVTIMAVVLGRGLLSGLGPVIPLGAVIMAAGYISLAI
ncbi:hypothetical protein DFH94DRAFT_738189 [Russula ochroleuca]|uniref:DUF423 domain-containing protein n=1 Tax=Russula ochroleuca TaxID=152965 RepID=A0A9P5MXQ1_9AGAM|nr:hypothetical protein DFH94DRAFT_738189 [Russula ochroleuca]